MVLLRGVLALPERCANILYPSGNEVIAIMH